MTETNRIEFKRELTDELDIEKEVIAFLNYREGGILYFGIDDDGKAIGVSDIDGDMLKIKDRIRKNVMPSPMGLFDVTAEMVDGVKVIKVFVASGSEKPYYKAKYGMSTRGCFIRVGTAAEPMTTAMIEDLFSHRVRNSLGRVRSPRQDLTFSQLRIYYEEKKHPLNENYLRNLELLTEDGALNYVAYLLADENGNSIKVAKYAGKDRVDLISNNEYGYCCLLTATRRVLEKLKVENAISTELTYMSRIDTPLWDERAIHEAVINFIVHNDYSREVPPKFEIFSDRLEITSYGRLPENMSEDEFFNGVSIPRNKELMRIFRDVEMVESLGSGMPRIMQVYGRECFTFMEHFTRFTVPFYKDIIDNVTEGKADSQKHVEKDQKHVEMDIEYVEKDEKHVEKGQEYVEKDEKHVEKTSKLILDLIRIEPNITLSEIARRTGLVRRSIEDQFNRLKRKNLIRRVGSRKFGHWEVIEQTDS
ncbi:MAG: putative DNA binding domain-containing protein [Bacteroidales bacterium]|nr:putative DNA binding domain-containing protein [Bacteroidales bacterium]